MEEIKGFCQETKRPDGFQTQERRENKPFVRSNVRRDNQKFE